MRLPFYVIIYIFTRLLTFGDTTYVNSSYNIRVVIEVYGRRVGLGNSEIGNTLYRCVKLKYGVEKPYVTKNF